MLRIGMGKCMCVSIIVEQRIEDAWAIDYSPGDFVFTYGDREVGGLGKTTPEVVRQEKIRFASWGRFF